MSKEKTMKYYSEKLDKLFDSLEELQVAEKSKSKRKTPVAEETQPAIPSRKELAAAVESADAAVKDAYAQYESAKVKAEELSKKYLEEVNSIIDPAQKAVKDAEQKRYEAIRNFNNSYGAYQVTYNGARAAEEMMKAIRNINSKSNFFRDFFWL